MWLPGGMEYNWVLDGTNVTVIIVEFVVKSNATIITFEIRPNATITKFDVSPNHIKRERRSGAAGCSCWPQLWGGGSKIGGCGIKL